MQEHLVESNERVVSLAEVIGRESLAPLQETRDDIQAFADVALETLDLRVYYGDFLAIRDVDLSIESRRITAIIGPSGCGKSTLLRAFNRMNELVPTARTEGEVVFRGVNIYEEDVDPVEVRRRVGMVFQKPNPFPKTIYENIAWGAKVNGYRGDMDALVEGSLTQAALWDEIKDKLDQSGLSLSGGQQQRLCIARAIAVKPDVILMDEPCSALDPVATFRIEELMRELSKNYTIVIVTHNMQQAARVSDRTGFFNLQAAGKPGHLIEMDDTTKIFSNPTEKATEDYISGRFG